MRLPPPDRVTDALREAAALDVLPRFRSLKAGDIMEKAPGDVVTVADIDAEHRLTPILEGLLPGSQVVGEEAFSRDPAILDRFDRHDAVWVIDPVDGTHNFSRGDERFCMMVGLILYGEVVMAWIHDPIPGDTALAEKGAGAVYRGNTLRVPEPPDRFEELSGSVNMSFWSHDRRAAVKVNLRRFAELHSLRCAGHDFLLMATGSRHFSMYRRLWPWDHVPGVLIFREAGGAARRVDGSAYRPGDRVAGLLSAANETLWARLQAFLV